MSFFILQAPYLPWVLIGFSVMLGNPIIVDAIGEYVKFILGFV